MKSLEPVLRFLSIRDLGRVAAASRGIGLLVSSSEVGFPRPLELTIVRE